MCFQQAWQASFVMELLVHNLVVIVHEFHDDAGVMLTIPATIPTLTMLAPTPSNSISISTAAFAFAASLVRSGRFLCQNTHMTNSPICV